MQDAVPSRALHWARQVLGPGARITKVERLPLGGWHINHRLTVLDTRGLSHMVVLRRWARPGWEIDDPDYTAAREAHVLGLLAPTSVPAPHLVAADPDGTSCGVPALLLSCLPGHPPSSAAPADATLCRELAQALAQIHAVGAAGQQDVPGYRLYYDRLQPAPPGWLPHQPIWQHAARIIQAAPPEPEPTLIHRDFHPENTLWSRQRLTGVVDWTQASWGPAALDLGHLRWNLVLDHGLAVADELLRCYDALTGSAADQPYWDLVAVFDLLLAGDPADPGDLDADDQHRLTSYVEELTARHDDPRPRGRQARSTADPVPG